ncbi:MAG: hypothetical protein M1820_003502 [Bogoriella megaspora]|nr:MAG: hypothetical protein M1820_003502 [Bogoriella megaspora]
MIPRDPAQTDMEERDQTFHRLMDENNPLKTCAAVLAEYRVAAKATICRDFIAAVDAGLLPGTWRLDIKLNNKYRAALNAVQNRAIEYQNVFAEYQKLFNKPSQLFYRSLVYELRRAYEGLPEFHVIIKTLGLQSEITPACNGDFIARDRDKVILNCSYILSCLGDLCRWREELAHGTASLPRDWRSVVAYYKLAGFVYPRSGRYNHQLGALMSKTGDSLSAIYYFYRAVTAATTDNECEKSLRRELHTVGKAVFAKSSSERSREDILVDTFLILQSHDFDKETIQYSRELEEAFLDDMGSALQHSTCEAFCKSVALKLVLTNFAAEYRLTVSKPDAVENPHQVQQSFVYRRINLRTCLVVFNESKKEIRTASPSYREQPGSNDLYVMAKPITPRARLLLSLARVCSAWLLRNYSETQDRPADTHEKSAWRAYATLLSVFASRFPANELPTADYMLEEDEETFGFAPLRNEKLIRRWETRSGLRKTSYSLQDSRHSEEVEALVRVRDILTDGLMMVSEGKGLKLKGTVFAYES